MSQSALWKALCAGTIFDIAKWRHGILDTSLNAKFMSEMNKNVSTILHHSIGYYETWLVQVQHGPATRSQQLLTGRDSRLQALET